MLGNTLAILCAISWSLSVILLKLSGARIPPLALNLLKNIVGLVLLASSALLIEGKIYWPADSYDTYLLFVSGFLGIGVADGLVLKAMQDLKATHIAMLECLFSPFVIILSIIMLGERPTVPMFVGGALIIGALFCIPPTDQRERSSLQSHPLRGLILMVVAMFLIAYGIILVKPQFTQLPLFSLVTIRMLAGVGGSLLVFGFTRKERISWRTFWAIPNKGTLFTAAFFSSYVSILLWVAGYKYLQASVAALLNQTSTVFTVLFAVVFLNERLSRRKWIALGLSILGVATITLSA